jgi:hypothetical protein
MLWFFLWNSGHTLKNAAMMKINLSPFPLVLGGLETCGEPVRAQGTAGSQSGIAPDSIAKGKCTRIIRGTMIVIYNWTLRLGRVGLLGFVSNRLVAIDLE